jgi:hypothetical protein
MSILIEELERMGRMAKSPYFAPALVLLSIAVGVFTVFGFIMQFFVSIFLEAVAWLIAIVASMAAGFSATYKTGAGLKQAALKGSLAMLEANLPRHVIFLLAISFSVLPFIISTGGSNLYEGITTFALIILALAAFNAAIGIVFGIAGGYIGGSKSIELVMRTLPTKPKRMKRSDFIIEK